MNSISAGECTDLSFPSTLNAEKNCDLIGDRFECVIFCHDSYTFGHDGGEGKRRTMSCTNGSWDTEWIPACVKGKLRVCNLSTTKLTKIVQDEPR